MANDYKIINTHAHLRTHSDVPKLVDEWRSEGVIRACVLALDKRFLEHEGYLDNAGVKKWMDKYPDIIVGAGNIDAGPQPDPASIVDTLYDQGFRALKVISPAKPYNDESFFGYYERAEALGMPFIFHTGIVSSTTGAGIPEFNVDANDMRPYRFDRVVRRFPNLKIIGAHLGLPHENEALRVIMIHKNVYYDFTGGGGSKTWVSEIKRTLAPFPGANWDDPEENVAKQYFKKLVFGTDNPPVALWKRNALDIMDYLHIDEEVRQDFFWRNAARIFGWTDLLES